ncbi:hypothetical protein CSUI_000263 [Cystoisospora suis]|uniref:Uncharacterized protein n=1 Tax=Cystoisospora suis TaxID=483139 RepID=A0A2C6LCW3_9APIC|nr:hypothetical protein CSUI_000263 [Cystoisospora suis]
MIFSPLFFPLSLLLPCRQLRGIEKGPMSLTPLFALSVCFLVSSAP